MQCDILNSVNMHLVLSCSGCPLRYSDCIYWSLNGRRRIQSTCCSVCECHTADLLQNCFVRATEYHTIRLCSKPPPTYSTPDILPSTVVMHHFTSHFSCRQRLRCWCHAVLKVIASFFIMFQQRSFFSIRTNIIQQYTHLQR